MNKENVGGTDAAVLQAGEPQTKRQWMRDVPSANKQYSTGVRKETAECDANKEIIKMKNAAKHEFEKHRKLFIQNVPPITHQDVRRYLGDIVPADIIISKRLQHVIITLKQSEEIDLALETLWSRLLAGHKVEVELYPRRMMLYICGLPPRFTTGNFREFLLPYGKVETAFLSLTSQGHCKGYGFVEFAHNRATLEKVQRTINGSTLESATLYCDLVPDTMLTYDDTLSKVLYGVCSGSSQLPTDPKMLKILQYAHITNLSQGKKVYILVCPSVQTAEELWYLAQSSLAASSSFHLRYAMPCTTAEGIVQLLSSAENTCEQLDNSADDVRQLLLSMFPHNTRVVTHLEQLIELLYGSCAGRLINREVVMNLVNNVDFSNQAPTLRPGASIPVLQFTQAQSMLHMVGADAPSAQASQVVDPPPYSRPVTRASSASACRDLLLSRECLRRSQQDTLPSVDSRSSDTSQHDLPLFSQSPNPLRHLLPAVLLEELERPTPASPPEPVDERRRSLKRKATFRKTPGAEMKTKIRKPTAVFADVKFNLFKAPDREILPDLVLTDLQ